MESLLGLLSLEVTFFKILKGRTVLLMASRNPGKDSPVDMVNIHHYLQGVSKKNMLGAWVFGGILKPSTTVCCFVQSLKAVKFHNVIESLQAGPGVHVSMAANMAATFWSPKNYDRYFSPGKAMDQVASSTKEMPSMSACVPWYLTLWLASSCFTLPL